MDSVFQVDGYSLIDSQNKTNASVLFTALKPYSEREGEATGAFAVIDELRRKFTGIKESIIVPLNPPSIPGLGTTGGFEFYIQNMGSGSSQDLEKITKKFVAKARERATWQEFLQRFRHRNSSYISILIATVLNFSG